MRDRCEMTWHVVCGALLLGVTAAAANGAIYFQDNFESVSAIDTEFDAASAGPWGENFDPKAGTGTYSMTQRSSSGGAINWALAQVTSVGPGFFSQDPGPAEGNQYLRLAMNDSANVVFMQGAFTAPTADDIRVQLQAYGYGSFGIRTSTSATAIQFRFVPATDDIGMPVTSVQIQEAGGSTEYLTTNAWTWHSIEIITHRTAGTFDFYVGGEQVSPAAAPSFPMLTAASSFSVLTAAPYSPERFAYLDDITVSSVPEPAGAMALWGLIVFATRRSGRPRDD